MRTIIRLVRTAAEALGWLGMPLDTPDGEPPARVGWQLAWELARIGHPTPAEEARKLVDIRETIEWARAMHARIDGAGSEGGR